MKKIIAFLTYLLIISSLLSASYSYTYISDLETSAGNLFSFSETFCPPYQPISPIPQDDSIYEGINPKLSVYISDPNKDSMDVYFYDAGNDTLIDMVADVESNSRVSVIWPNLNYGVSYEWYVVAKDNEGPTSSEKWKFTINRAPDNPVLLSPDDVSTDVKLSPTLEVYVSDPDGDTMNISFIDASENQPLAQRFNVSDGEKVSVTWSDLDYSYTYDWYVIADDGMIETRSDTWSFTTKSRPSENGGGNSGGGSGSSSNNPPTADAGGCYYGNVSEPILFDGSNSYDLDGSIVSFEWDLGDGTKSTEVTTKHGYSTAGTYNIILTVTDNDGAISSNSTTVTIHSILEINDILTTPNIQTPGQHINITCSLANISRLVNLSIHITYPDGNKTPISIYQNNIQNTSIYYKNQSYDLLGTYRFFITAKDIENNTAMSKTYEFSIVDTLHPEIKNITAVPNPQEIDSYVNISCMVTDNVEINRVKINITDPNGSSVNVTMYGEDYYYYNTTYTTLGVYNYYIWAEDINRNINISSKHKFSIQDTTAPEISHINATPRSQIINGTVNITGVVSDNVGVKEVILKITTPNNSTNNHKMFRFNQTNTYYYNTTYLQSGVYIIYIQAIDVNNNSACSNPYQFVIA